MTCAHVANVGAGRCLRLFHALTLWGAGRIEGTHSGNHQMGNSMANSDTRPQSFQDIILRLQAYWAAQGCAVLQPYDMEVGAGTFHPATTLRSLGAQPWAAAYVQPSRRPTDGRYGENPNRLQHYYQFQVLIKPSPPDLQAL